MIPLAAGVMVDYLHVRTDALVEELSVQVLLDTEVVDRSILVMIVTLWSLLLPI